MGWKENKKKYDQQWIRDHMKRVPLNLKNEDHALYQAHATTREESMTAFIKRAMEEQLKRDMESDAAANTPKAEKLFVLCSIDNMSWKTDLVICKSLEDAKAKMIKAFDSDLRAELIHSGAKVQSDKIYPDYDQYKKYCTVTVGELSLHALLLKEEDQIHYEILTIEL